MSRPYRVRRQRPLERPGTSVVGTRPPDAVTSGAGGTPASSTPSGISSSFGPPHMIGYISATRRVDPVGRPALLPPILLIRNHAMRLSTTLVSLCALTIFSGDAWASGAPHVVATVRPAARSVAGRSNSFGGLAKLCHHGSKSAHGNGGARYAAGPTQVLIPSATQPCGYDDRHCYSTCYNGGPPCSCCTHFVRVLPPWSPKNLYYARQVRKHSVASIPYYGGGTPVDCFGRPKG